VRCGGGSASELQSRGRCRGNDTNGSEKGGRNAGFGTFRERGNRAGPRGGQMN